VHLTAIPETGYFFALWGNAARGTINPLDFVVTNANPTVAALFLPWDKPSHPDGPGGRLWLHRPSAVGQCLYNGQTVTLTATPAPGQQFVD